MVSEPQGPQDAGHRLAGVTQEPPTHPTPGRGRESRAGHAAPRAPRGSRPRGRQRPLRSLCLGQRGPRATPPALTFLLHYFHDVRIAHLRQLVNDAARAAADVGPLRLAARFGADTETDRGPPGLLPQCLLPRGGFPSLPTEDLLLGLQQRRDPQTTGLALPPGRPLSLLGALGRPLPRPLPAARLRPLPAPFPDRAVLRVPPPARLLAELARVSPPLPPRPVRPVPPLPRLPSLLPASGAAPAPPPRGPPPPCSPGRPAPFPAGLAGPIPPCWPTPRTPGSPGLPPPRSPTPSAGPAGWPGPPPAVRLQRVARRQPPPSWGVIFCRVVKVSLP